jgi:hypothetical protein
MEPLERRGAAADGPGVDPVSQVRATLGRIEEIVASAERLTAAFPALLDGVLTTLPSTGSAPIQEVEPSSLPRPRDLLPGTRRVGIATTGPPLPPGMSNELVSWQGVTLNVEAMRSFQRASLALGAPIRVTDSYRSHAQQAAAYARKPGLAAPPGSSYHERGLAIDVDGDAYGGYGSEAFRRVAETLEALGWHRFDPIREPWHFSYRVTG